LFTLSAVLDLTRAWQTGGSRPWIGQTSVSHDGVDAARPDILSNNQTSWLKTTVKGPARISFWWETSSEAGVQLKFFVDKTLKATRSGLGGWQRKSFVIGPGTHIVKWEFKRDASGSAGLNTGLVDQVMITK